MVAGTKLDQYVYVSVNAGSSKHKNKHKESLGVASNSKS